MFAPNLIKGGVQKMKSFAYATWQTTIRIDLIKILTDLSLAICILLSLHIDTPYHKNHPRPKFDPRPESGLDFQKCAIFA